MAVKVTAATTKGHQLAEQEWNVVKAACDMMFKLDESKRKVSDWRPFLIFWAAYILATTYAEPRLQILEYVESRITLLAPNISAIVGTTTATKILGIAGGLNGLTRIPHSNIYVSPVSVGRQARVAHVADYHTASRGRQTRQHRILDGGSLRRPPPHRLHLPMPARSAYAP